MSRRRSLSEDERALWAGVTRSVVPLRRRPKPAPSATAAEPKPADPLPPPARIAVPQRSAPKPPSAPPLAPLGRRQKQRVARGRDAIDARIDLHGLTLPQAHAALVRFLRRAQADGAKIVLVVTGKGSLARAAGERGALRREVPMWLGLPDMRAYVVGFEDAHAGHGGEGALYVRVRRAQ